MSKLPNFDYGKVLPQLSGIAVNPAHAKLRQRLRSELEEDIMRGDDSRSQLFDILQDLDQGDDERIAQKNRRRGQIYDRATEAQLQLEDRLRQAQLDEDRAVAERIQRFAAERGAEKRGRGGARNDRLAQVLTQRAASDQARLERLQETEASRQARLQHLEETKQRQLQDLRQKRLRQQERQGQRFDELQKQMEDWEHRVLENARRRGELASTLREQRFRVAPAEERPRSASPGVDRKQLLEAGERREQRLREWEATKKEQVRQLIKRHADREHVVEGRQRVLDEQADARRLEAEEARRRKAEELETKRRQHEEERQQQAAEAERRRLASRQRAQGLQEELAQRREAVEATRRRLRADRFCQSLGLARGSAAYLQQSGAADDSGRPDSSLD